MIPEYIDEFSPGEQKVPMEWRPLLYKRIMWEVELIIWMLKQWTPRLDREYRDRDYRGTPEGN